MPTAVSFGEVLEAADNLSLEEQESLIDILYRRMAERRRRELAEGIQEARKEFQEGFCQPVTPNQLMAEILA